MKIKMQNLTAFFVVAASAVLLGAVGTARAADQWFVMGEQTLNATDPSAEIKTEGGRWKKDVKQVRLAVEGADVQMIKVVLGWDNRTDDTLAVGTVKAGGQTAPKDAPGRKGRLASVKIQYKILGNKPTATVKILGLDSSGRNRRPEHQRDLLAARKAIKTLHGENRAGSFGV